MCALWNLKYIFFQKNWIKKKSGEITWNEMVNNVVEWRASLGLIQGSWSMCFSHPPSLPRAIRVHPRIHMGRAVGGVLWRCVYDSSAVFGNKAEALNLKAELTGFRTHNIAGPNWPDTLRQTRYTFTSLISLIIPPFHTLFDIGKYRNWKISKFENLQKFHLQFEQWTNHQFSSEIGCSRWNCPRRGALEVISWWFADFGQVHSVSLPFLDYNSDPLDSMME